MDAAQMNAKFAGSTFEGAYGNLEEYLAGIFMIAGRVAKQRLGGALGPGAAGAWGLCVAAVAGSGAAGRFRRLGFGARGRAAVAPVAVLALASHAGLCGAGRERCWGGGMRGPGWGSAAAAGAAACAGPGRAVAGGVRWGVRGAPWCCDPVLPVLGEPGPGV